MGRLFTLFFCLVVTAMLLPATGSLAVGQDTPVYTHFLYMFAHDGWLHYSVNAVAFLVMHHVYSRWRWVAAYLSAVAASFWLENDRLVVGASVLLCFFVGCIAPVMWKRRRLLFWQTVAILLIQCFIPYIAGMWHLVMVLFGLVYVAMERIVSDIRHNI